MSGKMSDEMEDPKRKVRNRRLDDDDEEENMSMGWRLCHSMGMPMLYICAFCLGITGVICNGVITNYWSSLDPPLCYLYSTTPSLSLHFRFGGPVSGCQWVTFGGATALVLLVISAAIYFITVRGKRELHICLYILEVLSLLGSIMMLAVTCSLTEGLRQTCATMGLNQFNMRGEDCHGQLNMRIANFNLSVSSSTLIKGALYSLWPATVLMIIITCFHLASCYRRCYR